MHSRLSTYLHPLAGRPLAWHSLVSLAELRPARLVFHSRSELHPDSLGQIGMPLVHTLDGSPRDSILVEGEVAIVVDAAAPVLTPVVRELLSSTVPAFATDRNGRVTAARLEPDQLPRLLENGSELSMIPEILPDLLELPARPEALAVTDRVTLASAGAIVRDRIVARLMAAGATFLLPESVLVDVDVRIGRDTIVYPGVVIEGETTIGEETVVGPGCRIVDSWIGSGVELKGWNFISRTSIRHRAILEPHVRRGFD